MTENEAITQLKIQRTFTNGANAKVQAIDMAIQALEKNKQYHAFGTVEEIDSMFKSGTKTLELSKKVIETAMCKLGKYEAIGTIEELQALKEKAEPKKPITYQKTNRADCPVCGKTVRGIDKPFGDWCANCGQKLDWEE